MKARIKLSHSPPYWHFPPPPPAEVMYRAVLGRLVPPARSGLTCRRWKSAPAPPATAAASVTAEPFLTGTSSSYVEEMYGQWLRDPTSVHAVSRVGLWGEGRGFESRLGIGIFELSRAMSKRCTGNGSETRPQYMRWVGWGCEVKVEGSNPAWGRGFYAVGKFGRLRFRSQSLRNILTFTDWHCGFE